MEFQWFLYINQWKQNFQSKCNLFSIYRIFGLIHTPRLHFLTSHKWIRTRFYALLLRKKKIYSWNKQLLEKKNWKWNIFCGLVTDHRDFFNRSRAEVFEKKAALNNFTKFRWKHLRRRPLKTIVTGVSLGI